MTTHKTCHGTMFPDVLSSDLTGRHVGKALSFSIQNIGLSRGQRSVDVDIAAWDECVSCSEFEDCYKLSMAKLALQSAIRDA